MKSTTLERDTWVSVATAARMAFGEITFATRKQILRAYERGHLRGRRQGPRGWVEISADDLFRWKAGWDR